MKMVADNFFLIPEMIFSTSMARSMQKSLASNASWILTPEVTLNNGWQSIINFHTSLSVSRWHKDKVANRDLYRHGYKDSTKQSGALLKKMRLQQNFLDCFSRINNVFYRVI